MISVRTIQKRSHERIPASLVVKFMHGDSTCYGIAVNLSKGGMCINSGICLPCESDAQLLIPIKDDHIKLPIRVRWVEKTCEFYDSMGVELLTLSKRYLNFVENFESSSHTE